MVVLAFLVPLALAVEHLSRTRALSDAERQTAVVVALLAVTNEPQAVAGAIAHNSGEHPERVSVHGLAAGSVGLSHAKPTEVRLVAGQGRSAVVPVPGGVAYLEPVDLGDGRTAVVEVMVPDAELTRGVPGAWLALVAVAAFLLGASVLIGDRLAAKVVNSARGLGRAARALGDGDLGVRVAPGGPRELEEAGLAFNAMADRVLALLSAERELIADLSHRLRTPLTALRLEAERLDGDGYAYRMRQAVEAMEREVDSLIRTARGPSAAVAAAAAAATPTAPAEPDKCDASEVVRERMTFWGAVADDQSRAYQILGADITAPVPLPRSDLAAAVDALLGNVFRYTPQGTAFEVAVSRWEGYVTLRVDDAGPGITDPDRALRRGASQRGSTGLGLDIVRRAAVAARGSVDIGEAALGGASVVMLLADAETPPPGRPWLGFVGRLSKEPTERRVWGHRRGANLS